MPTFKTAWKTKGLPAAIEEIALLRTELAQTRQALAALQATSDLRWDADMRAIRRWQRDAPGRLTLWPDQVDLICWLLEQLEEDDD